MAEEADHIFVYGKLRPDAPENTDPLGNTSGAKKAYLMGSRLYCFNRGGQQKAAVRLEEAGYAVTGYVVKASDSAAMPALLHESESKEYSPQLYERDIVEVNLAFLLTCDARSQHALYFSLSSISLKHIFGEENFFYNPNPNSYNYYNNFP